MAESFLPILLLMVAAAGIAAVILLLSAHLGPNRPTREKLGTYESGVPLVDASRKRLPRFGPGLPKTMSNLRRPRRPRRCR